MVIRKGHRGVMLCLSSDLLVAYLGSNAEEISTDAFGFGPR